MYAYYVEVLRVLILWSNFQYITPVEVLVIFLFFGISTFHTLVTVCAKTQKVIYMYNSVLTCI